jgi:hypothetical protein
MPKQAISIKDRIIALFSTLSTEEARSVRDSLNAILALKREATTKPRKKAAKPNTHDTHTPQLDEFGR